MPVSTLYPEIYDNPHPLDVRRQPPLAANVEETVATRDAVDQFLRILAAHDPSFMTVVNAIQAGCYSTHSIGAHADMSCSTVHKKLKQMRELWGLVEAGQIGIDRQTRRIRTPRPMRRRAQALAHYPGT